MATTEVRALLSVIASVTPASPRIGALLASLSVSTDGEKWTSGNGSGQADTVYIASGSLTSGGSVSYNTLAAGALLDIDKATVDLDELKGIMVVCLTGSIKVDAPAANFAPFFGTASDFIPLTAGECWVRTFGAVGRDVQTNSKWDIVETASSNATYTILFWGAS